ncbi:LexA-binding, inner membrane-associated putative hydrolase [Dysgonomonas alginatilytica]|uniref:LexA-binding, inner membrane-associated putative hydrolase n=1 Tax=Dysgonomonas alginatilytica TaxID=1605892 RepID=A0A2V3PT44_9BACT|nr:metal-dependent hydrolase [Dysgonomonas alginatilytica]PXV67368.1 LexA-binding, inner membrane-associated putative hydrolase [Dysgonomonas alginatilytica]
MDILTHTLSGVAVATVVANYNKVTPLRKAQILSAGAIGGALPDIDAVSMWSEFDQTFGALFNLSHSGRVIYGSKFWYSHHAFFHSLPGSLILAILFFLVIYLIKKRDSSRDLMAFYKTYSSIFIAFILGYWAHLAGDLPTPASVWGGIGFFWPSENYIGGYGKIWWWNNYDIFLLIVCCIALNIAMPAISKSIRSKSGVFSLSVAIVTFLLILVQINTRHYDYSYADNRSNYTKMEQKSKEEQKRVLGDRLYRYMDKLDRSLKINF